MKLQTWASGISELLRHAIHLSQVDSDRHRRLAFISTDNAVELAMQTFLSLPSRVTGVKLNTGEFERVSRTFPGLLRAIEEHAGSRIVDIDVEQVIWLHERRNLLYHHGNGVTIEREKLDLYLQIARRLFFTLFGVDIQAGAPPDDTALVVEFVRQWQDACWNAVLMFVSVVRDDYNNFNLPTAFECVQSMSQMGILDPMLTRDFFELDELADQLFSNQVDPNEILSRDMVSRAREASRYFSGHTDPWP